MINGPPSPRRPGFALRELGAAVLLLAVALALAAICGGHARRNARVGHELSNFRFVYSGTASYGADHDDRHWMFTWKAGTAPIDPTHPAAAGVTFAADDVMAARNQLVWIMRTHGGRGDMPAIPGLNLFPYIVYGHLVLSEYLNVPLPDPRMISPGDRHRQLWAGDPHGYDQGLYTPNLGTGNDNKRHPYAGLYLASCFFDGSPVGYRVSPGPVTDLTIVYLQPPASFGGRPLTDVAFPSQKAMRHDRFARFFGERTPWYSHSEARLPVLFCDGAAALKSAAEANRGASPNLPADPPYTQLYRPGVIDPPATGANADPMWPGFSWTRMGLRGLDFGGPDVYP